MERLTIPDRYNTGSGICFANPNDPEGGYNITNLDPRIDAECEILESIAERLCAYEDAEEQGRSFTAKYKVGTKMWGIKATCELGEPCKECGNKFFNRKWVLEDEDPIFEIHGIRIIDGAVYYKVWRPCVYYESVSEYDIGRIYFLTRAEAEAALASQEGEAKHG